MTHRQARRAATLASIATSVGIILALVTLGSAP